PGDDRRRGEGVDPGGTPCDGPGHASTLCRADGPRAQVVPPAPLTSLTGTPMAVNKYCRAVLDALEGQSDGLRGTPPERLDWAGAGAALDLFERTAGAEREEVIHAIGELIHRHPAEP